MRSPSKSVVYLYLGFGINSSWSRSSRRSTSGSPSASCIGCFSGSSCTSSSSSSLFLIMFKGNHLSWALQFNTSDKPTSRDKHNCFFISFTSLSASDDGLSRKVVCTLSSDQKQQKHGEQAVRRHLVFYRNSQLVVPAFAKCNELSLITSVAILDCCLGWHFVYLDTWQKRQTLLLLLDDVLIVHCSNLGAQCFLRCNNFLLIFTSVPRTSKAQLSMLLVQTNICWNIIPRNTNEESSLITWRDTRPRSSPHSLSLSLSRPEDIIRIKLGVTLSPVSSCFALHFLSLSFTPSMIQPPLRSVSEQKDMRQVVIVVIFSLIANACNKPSRSTYGVTTPIFRGSAKISNNQNWMIIDTTTTKSEAIQL